MISMLQYVEWGFYIGIILIVWAVITYVFWIKVVGRTDRKWIKASKTGFIAGLVIFIISVDYLYLYI